jgi:outer membrane lipoprotein-sorting protein
MPLSQRRLVTTYTLYKKYIALSLPTFLLLVLLSACGGNSTQTTSKPTPTVPPTPTPGQGQTILNTMASKLNNAKTLQGTFRISTSGQSVKGNLTSEVWKEGTTKSRSEIVQSSIAQEQSGSLTVTDGKTIWQYNPATRTAYKGPANNGSDQGTTGNGISTTSGGGSQLFLNIIQLIFTQSNGTLRSSSTSINGHSTYDIHVVPQDNASSSAINSFNYSGEVYIDKTTQLPVRVNLNVDGFGNVIVDITKLQINPKLSSSLFIFTPPAGTKVLPLQDQNGSGNNSGNTGTISLAQAQKQAGYHLLSIPGSQAAYVLNGVTALGAGGNQTYALSYMKGNIPFTITESKSLAFLPAQGQKVQLRGTTGAISSSNGTTTLNWTEHNIGISISGKLPASEITTIANSLS